MVLRYSRTGRKSSNFLAESGRSLDLLQCRLGSYLESHSDSIVEWPEEATHELRIEELQLAVDTAGQQG